jgi:phospholipid-binding lipoprotein MlaA
MTIAKPRGLDYRKPAGGAPGDQAGGPAVSKAHLGKTRLRAAAGIALALALGCCGCAGRSAAPANAEDADSDNDPAEPVNRAIFKANMAADRAVIKPVAEAYTDHVPEIVRTGVHNVVQNLKEPGVAINDLLQGNVGRAWQSMQRLAVNTTVGGVGLVDVAAKWGLPPHRADFGQTLAVWGVGEGPFVELPLLGPSNPRDAVGAAVDMALNPLTFVGGAPATYASAASTGANVVDVRAQHLKDLDDLERNSLDFYATMRSVYRQHRDAEIAAAKKPEEPAQGRVDISFPDAPASPSGQQLPR